MGIVCYPRPGSASASGRAEMVAGPFPIPQLTIIGPAPAIHFFNQPPGMHIEAVRLKAEWSRDLLRLDPLEYLNETREERNLPRLRELLARSRSSTEALAILLNELRRRRAVRVERVDRKSTRLNSSH